MAVNYKKIEKIIKPAISDLGENRTVTLLQPSTSPYDATKPFEGPADNMISYIVKAIVLAPPGVSLASRGSRSQRDIGVDQARGDFIVYITGSELSVHPTVGWLCVIDDQKFRVVSVTRTRPGKTILLWKLTLER